MGEAGGRWGAGGRRRLAARGPLGPRAAKQKSGAGASGPGPRSFRARSAQPPPPGTLVVFRPFGQGACSFAPISCKQNKPAAHGERRASIFRWKSEEVFQQVFPRFFQKRAGGAEPSAASGGKSEAEAQ